MQQALVVREEVQSLYTDNSEVDVGFSTLGLKEHENIHKNPLAFKNTP